MDYEIRGETVTYKSCVLNKSFTKEDTTEVIIPDTMPDAISIICAVCSPVIRSKDASMGSMSAAGVCDVTVIYAADTTDVPQRLTASFRFSASAEGEGVSESSRLICGITPLTVDARMLNPRKLSIRAELSYDFRAYEDAELRFCDKIQSEDGIESCTCERIVRIPSAVSEKTFTITDSVRPEGMSGTADDILLSKVSFRQDDVRQVGSKVVVKGSAVTEIVYSDNEKIIRSAVVESPYSQIVDMECTDEAFCYDTVIALTGSRITPAAGESSAFSVEISAVLQCTAYTERNISLMDDAYSTKYDISAQKETEMIVSLMEKRSCGERVSGNVNVSGCDRIIWGGITGCGPVPCDSEKNTVPVYATVLYVSETGEICSGCCRIDCPVVSGGMNNSIYFGPVSCSVNEDGIEISVPFKAECGVFSENELGYILSLHREDDAVKDTSKIPSMVILRDSRETDVWQAAKKYNSTPDLIRKANSLEDDARVCTSEILVIPCVR